MRAPAVVCIAMTLALSCCVAGCSASRGQTEPTQDAPAVTAKVSRVVFVDQEQACDCTTKRIGVTWTALQEALAGRQDLPVERIHADTQPTEAAPYLELRPMMVAPGVYFLDVDGGLIDQLQGELTAIQIAEKL